MDWLNIQTSLFDCVSSNQGRICTIHEALVMSVMKEHSWFFKDDSSGKYITGESVDDDTIISLRTDPSVTAAEKIMLKKTLQCWTPSGCYSNKSRNPQKQVLIHTNPVIQFDFDHLEQYDLEEVKDAIFALPFICCVGLSCSGNGLFALGLIEEPERLSDYAKHCFDVFASYGLPIDNTKGRNYNDLRFVTYDKTMRFKTNPVPLKIKRFNAPKLKVVHTIAKQYTGANSTLQWAIKQVHNAQVGQRFEVVRKAAYTLGGVGEGLEEIKQAIRECSQYRGVESKYIQHAEDAYAAGELKPLNKTA